MRTDSPSCQSNSEVSIDDINRIKVEGVRVDDINTSNNSEVPTDYGDGGDNGVDDYGDGGDNGDDDYGNYYNGPEFQVGNGLNWPLLCLFITSFPCFFV
jgi:hypothetical protein